MSEMEEKLGAILNNPQMMQQVMSLAQSLGQQSSPEKQDPPPQQDSKPSSMPDFDPKLLQQLSGITGQSSIDREQKALLNALYPYLSRQRVEKLEKAMRAAKMATLASSFLGQGGLSFLTGR